MVSARRLHHSIGMLIETLQALAPLLCAGCVAGAVALDFRMAKAFPARRDTEDAVDERFALKLVSDSLIRTLELRPELHEQVLGEVRKERALVIAWLRRPRAPQRSAET
jgi:hypothetical protein